MSRCRLNGAAACTSEIFQASSCEYTPTTRYVTVAAGPKML